MILKCHHLSSQSLTIKFYVTPEFDWGEKGMGKIDNLTRVPLLLEKPENHQLLKIVFLLNIINPANCVMVVWK